MHKGRLLCPHDREAAEAAERQASEASEEASHAAWIERIEAAAVAATEALKARGQSVVPLAILEEKVKVKTSAYPGNGSRKTWWEIKEEIGNGWVLFTATHDQLEGDTTHAAVALTEDGRLFWAGTKGEVEFGRKRLLGGPRETVLPVYEELDLDEKNVWNAAREVALRELEAQLTRAMP